MTAFRNKEYAMSSILLSLAFVLAAPADKPSSGYAKPELLVEAPDLMKLPTKRMIRVLDARGRGKYLEGHAPGAVWIDAAAWAHAFAVGQDAAKWEQIIAPLGIFSNDTIVIYDDNQSKDAARIWYILRYWGFDDVRLLNGGWKAWQATGAESQKDTPAVQPTKDLKLKPEPERLATKAQLLELLKSKPPQIVDARSEGEFCGTEETAKRNGSIPGAAHVEWSDTLDAKTGRFKSADELGKLFEKAGVDPSKPAVTYCQSGGRAAVLAFALELMGGKDVRNYYRSWSEWGNDPATPIVKPKPEK
ncbi:MAG TPA: sulfurtransferase [Planctomycetales bacterium]|nr:sulfurtransferase [Planctomycetales bacterium]